MSSPVISYPPELPVSAARDEIADAIRDHQVVIVAGATGSGKTTQLPKIALELGRERIAHTQPRRLAARTIAERVAEELRVELGTLVGYKVRFTDKVSDETRIALMTDGILLNEIHRDRLLTRYDTIIIDEAHERSLNVDFLLGYLARILPERPDLKVVITSATIDPESFARHFAAADGTPAPVIEVSGRTYPVEIRYRPLVDEDAEQDAAGEPEDEVSAIVTALRELDREAPGDVLVFLPGEAEIRDAADAVRAAYAKDRSPTEVLPLFGRLSAAEQHRVFERSTVAGVRRRVVLATNVAETSLTVPGIKYVIDTGTARISRYSNRSKVQRLPIEAISQASANQRSGRAGRTSDGIAIRLYSEEDYARRPEFTEPEILRTSLASVILQMLALGFGDITAFPFLTPPDSRGVKAAFDLLTELGALRQAQGPDDGPRLTRIGRDIARMPMDPRFARMLIEAGPSTGSGTQRGSGPSTGSGTQRGAGPSTGSGTQRGAGNPSVLRDVLAIVAGLSIQDVRERPEDRREEADRLHARFVDPTSDFLTLLNLWNHLREQQRELGSSAFRRLCRNEHLNYVRVREWFDVHRQLRTLVKSPDRGAEPGGAADPDAIHRALLSGLLSQIGVLDERTAPAGKAHSPAKDARRRITEYRGARGIRFSIFPGSGLRKKSPRAVMAAEIVETSRTFARTVAAIDPAWAEPLAGDLAKRQVTEPHWSKDAGAAVAFEKVTLFGVEIIPRRRVQFARIDRAASRELFVRHALVEGEWDPSRIDKRVSAFWRSNAELRRRLEKLEERERRRDILAGDEAVFRFYDERIPAEVFDVRSFEKWWREALTTTPKLLVMRESDLIDDEDRADQREFPTRWTQGDQVLGLAYRFEPGAPDDGVSVVLPLPLLAQIEDRGFDWQVPGLRAELVTGLLRALPKAIRRHVVPAADWAEKFGAALADEGPEVHGGLPPRTLKEALARLVQPLANQVVTAADFDDERVPAHLRMNFRAVDERGRVVGSGRDLRALQAELSDRARSSVARSIARPGRAEAPGPRGAERVAAAPVEQTGLTAWTFGDLPAVIDTKVAGGVVRGYPAIVDAGKSVSVRVEATPDAAAAATRDGVLRLVLLAVPSPSSYVQQHLTSQEKLALAASPYPSAAALIEDCRAAVARRVIDASTGADGQDRGVVRTEAEFARVRDAVSAVLVDELFACVSLVARILTKAREVERGIKSQNSLALLGPLNDIRTQLSGLLHPGFVAAAGVDRLAHFPRYLDGMIDRLKTLANEPGKDRARMTEFERMAVLFADAGGTIPLAPDAPPAIVEVRWLLEEYRVSVFAQRLGTAQPVSPQRITKALAGK
ncbi:MULTISPECIES: ATP-dependent RNA helicase HrpA [unclassified Microbacterium]|uniref:ATP-dependent RNA helicase HrpA n=1 Tax=unclassified Microbacterium TaxID=2609290 RepID=UPI0024688EB6|nr:MULTISPECIES: ATP-dependent RNA helicase HrpA [unclassified Microbacterium]MDH5134817.1 ATP-dependent RNA helicase HrpA [Microbacterium sp. RD10]MDH5144654.1 ATP-dependent RNA helicase HrpA [Microbacterium sp. RD12]MDH5154669.1 ATP-dependent RNA helicase HrpA [Microbacterium sp. RD06]MDH5167718.1 ATP-dependent RNA helicase HrpA [Microbacterium sp. RD02]